MAIVGKHTVEKAIKEMVRWGKTKKQARKDAYWENIGDVDWEDLQFYLTKSRRDGDKESFDTALRVLEALRKQTLERKK